MQQEGRQHELPPSVASAVRTLIASGFEIDGSERSPTYIEIKCSLRDRWGVPIPYLISLTGDREFDGEEAAAIRESAESQNRIPIFVCAQTGVDHLSWAEFTDSLGGVVPSWIALNDDYRPSLITASKNEVPEDSRGEAWFIFENLVADGFEFLFGKRALRLGGAKRGKPVSDVHVQTPAGEVIVLDSKATRSRFDATVAALRPLMDYVRNQRIRQQGAIPLIGAAVVAPEFQQNSSALAEASLAFNSEVHVPVSFLKADVLADSVELMRDSPNLRSAIRWHQVFKGGLVADSAVANEIQSINDERVTRG